MFETLFQFAIHNPLQTIVLLILGCLVLDWAERRLDRMEDKLDRKKGQ